MNWPTAFVLFLFSVAAAAFIAVPIVVLVRARRGRRERVELTLRSEFTWAGLCFQAVLVTALFAGLAAPGVSPDSWFGDRMSTWRGQLGFVTVLTVVAAVLEFVLRRMGVRMRRTVISLPKDGITRFKLDP